MAFIHCKLCRKTEFIQPARAAYMVPGVCTSCRRKLQGVTRRTLQIAKSLERIISQPYPARRAS